MPVLMDTYFSLFFAIINYAAVYIFFTPLFEYLCNCFDKNCFDVEVLKKRQCAFKNLTSIATLSSKQLPSIHIDGEHPFSHVLIHTDYLFPQPLHFGQFDGTIRRKYFHQSIRHQFGKNN